MFDLRYGQTGRGGRQGEPISVVIPVCERTDNLLELHHEYAQALREASGHVEFIYVLDGHRQTAIAQLQILLNNGESLRIVRLGNEAGEATAIMIGVQQARNDLILLLPAYRQVAAASLPGFVASLGNYDMLLAVRWPRSDSAFNRAATRTFSGLLRLVSGMSFSDIGCSVRLVRRHVFNEVVLYGDQHRFLPLLALQRGFTTGCIEIPQDAREDALRMYRPGVYLRRALDVLAVFFVVKFTKKPLRFFGLIGSAMGGFSLLLFALLVIQRGFYEMPLADRPMLLVSALIGLLGVQLFALGLIGELIIFAHARELKEYSIAELINFKPSGKAETRDSPSGRVVKAPAEPGRETVGVDAPPLSSGMAVNPHTLG